MANSEHISLVRSGASAIATWREVNYMIPNPSKDEFKLSYRLEDRSTHETFRPEFVHGRAKLDLTGAFLSGIKLPGADLSYDDLAGCDLTGSNLRSADLFGCTLNSAVISRSNLSRITLTRANMVGCSLIRSDLSSSTLEMADLSGADLAFANLTYCNLEGANLSGANLTSTDLSWANLARTNLRGANISLTSLMMADLTGADLRGAQIMNADLESSIFMNAVMAVTKIVNCDLRGVIGLDMVNNQGPSTISLDTISKSGGMIPESFLRSAGVAGPLIQSQEALRDTRRRYPTVLIVGASSDTDLAEKIRDGLAKFDVPSWTMVGDDEEAVQSNKIILSHSTYYDSLLILATENSLGNSLTSQYYSELLSTTRVESKQNITVVATDDILFNREDRLCTSLRERSVHDLRGWDEGPHSFDVLLEALAKALYQDSPW